MNVKPEVRDAAFRMADGCESGDDKALVIEFLRLNATSKVFNRPELGIIHAPQLMEHWRSESILRYYDILVENGA